MMSSDIDEQNSGSLQPFMPRFQSTSSDPLTIDSILENLASHQEFNDVRDQLKLLQATQQVEEPKSIVEVARSERVAQYERTTCDLGQWTPSIQQLEFPETQIVFGKGENAFLPSRPIVDFKSLTSFEKEMTSVFSQNTPEASAIMQYSLASESIRQKSQSQCASQLKSVLRREHQKQKRINKIRSKKWHKVHRKQDEKEKMKLMGRLEVENPDLAQQIQQEFQKKWSHLRLLRKQNARKKWAQMAFRFSGKEINKEVAQQAQREHDEKNALKQIAKAMPITTVDDEMEAQEEDESEQTTTPSRIASRTFMKEAMEKKRNQENDQSGEELYDSETEEFNLKCNAKPKISLPTFSKEQLAEAADTLNTVSNPFDFYAPSRLTSLSETKDQISLKAKETNPWLQIDYTPAIEVTTSTSNNTDTPYSLDGIMDEVPSIMNEEQKRIVRQAFISDDFEKDFDDFVEKEIEDEDDNKSTGVAPGWGHWYGHGLPLKEKKTVEKKKQLKKKRKRVHLSGKLDRKVAKYYVPELPHPYTSPNQYNIVHSFPLGKEWNTLATYNRLIQPKTHVKLGCVIQPPSHHIKTKGTLPKAKDPFLKKDEVTSDKANSWTAKKVKNLAQKLVPKTPLPKRKSIS